MTRLAEVPSDRLAAVRSDRLAAVRRVRVGSRNPPKPEGIRQALELLEAGHPLMMFPAGTRSTDGEVQPFKAGIGLVVLRSGVPVIPVSVDGTRRAWRRGESRPRLFGGPITIRYGKQTTYSRPTKAKDVAADLRDRILVLRAAGQPGSARDGADPHEEAGGSSST